MKQKYIIEIKPGVYYIEKPFQTYDLTDNIELATKYPYIEHDLESKAKQVFGHIKIYNEEEKDKRIKALFDEIDSAFKNMNMFERLYNQWKEEWKRLDEELMKIDKP